jgi:ABC-2 type transport system ATP-binding protein
MSEDAIITKDLTKSFKDLIAVDSLRMNIQAGELFGLLGPNGAGKTTTVRMLCTLLKPTRGTATVAGYDLVQEPEKVRREIGIVSEGVMLYKELSIEENLNFLGKLYDLPKKETESRRKELLELFNFREKAKKRVSELSSGWTKKALISAALLHNPQILFLDEVTTGLDPQSAKALQDFTRRLCDQGVTVIWTTHYMTEPEKICDRIGIIYDGRLIRVGTPHELKRSITEFSIIEVESPGLSSKQIKELQTLEEVCNLTYRDPFLKIRCMKDEDLPEKIAKILISQGAAIKNINTKEPTLEETFIALTGGEEKADMVLSEGFKNKRDLTPKVMNANAEPEIHK